MDGGGKNPILLLVVKADKLVRRVNDEKLDSFWWNEARGQAGKRGQGVLLIGGGSAKPALANLVGALQSGILQRSVQWGQVLLFGNINS
jgi:hypothetical protein